MVQLDSRVPASKEEKLVEDSTTVSRYELTEAVLHAVAVTVKLHSTAVCILPCCSVSKAAVFRP